MMSQLTLYHKGNCPYCQKVFKFMESQGISLAKKSTDNVVHRQELTRIGGKPQVPCLIIDGKALYESDDIVLWLKKNYKHP